MAVTITNDAATTRTNLGLGDAATKTVGTASGNIPVLDVSGKIPSSTVDALPSGGSVGQVVTNTAAGTGTWQDSGGKVVSVRVSSSVTTATQAGSNTEQWISIPGLTNITHSMSKASNMILLEWTVPAKGNASTDKFSCRPYVDGAEDNQGGIYVMSSTTSDIQRNPTPLKSAHLLARRP